MEIIEKSIEELIPYENNPRKNDEAVEKVALSISAFGFKVPIVIDKNNVIVTGHTRLKAAKKLGLKSVPCIQADDLTEEQIKAFRLADNKTAELAEWDFEKLEKELEEINNIDMKDFGFEIDFGEEVYENINDANLKSTDNKIHFLKIDDKKIELFDEEYEELIKKLDEYLNMNSVVYGFVRWLLNGC